MPPWATLLGVSVLVLVCSNVMAMAANSTASPSLEDSSQTTTEDIEETTSSDFKTTYQAEAETAVTEEYDGTDSTDSEDSDLLCDPESLASDMQDDAEEAMLFSEEVEEEDLDCKDKVDVVAPKVLIGETDAVRIVDLNSSADRAVANRSQLMAYSVDYHYRRQFVFFVTEQRIIRAKLVSVGLVSGCRALPVNLTGPTTLAVDWENDELYWMTDNQTGVERSDLDGTNRTTLFGGQLNASYPNNIVVDPYVGFLFVANDGSVYRASLDGSDLTRLPVSDEVGFVRCIALDRPREKLYFLGLKNDNVSYVATRDYYGTRGRVVLERSLTDQYVWDDVLSMDFFRDRLILATYYKDYRNSVTSLSREGMWEDIAYATDVDKGVLWAVKVLHPNVQRRSDRRECLGP